MTFVDATDSLYLFPKDICYVKTIKVIHVQIAHCSAQYLKIINKLVKKHHQLYCQKQYK